MDSAIKIGFLAFAIAVLIKTPSQPNSIAIEASDAVPIPASTMTGTLELFLLKKYLIYLEFLFQNLLWPKA